MRILALVPPDPHARAASRYTFLSEELAAFVSFGNEVHTISPYVTEDMWLGRVQVHRTPRIRDIIPSVRTFARRSLARHACPVEDLSTLQRHSLGILCDRISDVARANHIDVIYSPFAWPYGTGGVVTTLDHGIPVVISLRGVDALPTGLHTVLVARAR